MEEHPDDQHLQDYLAGTLLGPYDSIDKHLESCDRCADRIATLDEPEDELLSRLRESDSRKGRSSSEEDLIAFLPVSQRYEIGSHIARGGMGEIRHAADLKLRRGCAVKIMLPKFAGDKSLVRFFREAQITGSLQHPGIPPVYDVGRLPDDRPFIAMKLIEGQTLKELLDKQKSTYHLQSHLAIFRSVCQTIAYAHAEGVIHCDLKPDNIMVGPFGEVQVMDWGLAKRVFGSQPLDEQTENVSPFDHALSRQGSACGTPGYMSPEQAAGNQLKVRQQSDVFSLGAILYEILQGSRPYRWDTKSGSQPDRAVDITAAIKTLQTSSVDESLQSLVATCLAEDPEQRPRDGGCVAELVNAYLLSAQERARMAEAEVQATQIRERETKKRRTQQAWFAGLATVGMLAVAISWLSIQSSINQRIADQNRTLTSSIKSQLAEANSAMAAATADPLEYSGYEESAQESIDQAEQLLSESQIKIPSISKLVQQEKRSIQDRMQTLTSMRQLASQLREAMAGIESLPVQQQVAVRKRHWEIKNKADSHRTNRFGPSPPFSIRYVRASDHLDPETPVFPLSEFRCELLETAFDRYGLAVEHDVQKTCDHITGLPADLQRKVVAAINLWSIYAADAGLKSSKWLQCVVRSLDEEDDISDQSRNWRSEARQAIASRSEKKLSNAYQHAFAVLSQQPPELIYALAKFHYHFVDDDPKLLKEAHLQYPSNYEINYELAFQATSHGRRSSDTFHHAVAASIERPESAPYLMLARSLFRSGRQSEVARILETASPDTGFQLYQWGMLFCKHYQPGVTKLLEDAIRRGHQEPHSVEAILGDWHSEGRRYDRAVQSWRAALASDQLSAEEYERIQQKLKNLIDTKNDDSERPDLTRTISPGLRALIASGRYEKALQRFERAFELNPKKVELFGFDAFRVAMLSVKHAEPKFSKEEIQRRESMALEWLEQAFESIRQSADFLTTREIRHELVYWLDDRLFVHFEPQSQHTPVAAKHRELLLTVKGFHDSISISGPGR